MKVKSIFKYHSLFYWILFGKNTLYLHYKVKAKDGLDLDNNFIGKQFGDWTVLKKEERKRREEYWLCQCKCGTERAFKKRRLKNGIVTDCGCKRKSPLKDLTGLNFGKLTAVELIGLHRKKDYWLLACDCGGTIKATAEDLKNGDYSSCGCSRWGKAYKHGMVGTHIYYCWSGMKDRCSNPNTAQYHNYGGRGIKFCSEWQDFKKFYEWAINNGYKESLTLERVNVDGNYEPSNCTWIEKQEQQWNKTDTVRTIINGEKKTVRDIAEESGLLESTIRSRISRYGWQGENILQPIKGLIQIEIRGELLTIYEIVEKYNLNLQTLRSRYQAGDRGERLIRPARKIRGKNY